MYSNLYGLKDWEKFGFGFANGNEARSKLFDLILRQYITLYDDPNVQSLSKNCQLLHEAEDFVMGNVLFLGLNLVSGVVDLIHDEDIIKIVQRLSHYTNNSLDTIITTNEILHIRAVILWSEHKFTEAIRVYQSILEANPLDLLALKFCHDLCFYTGAMGDVCGHYPSTLKRLDKGHPLYSYVMAMYSFAKIELLDYETGEKLALQSLAMNPGNAWATHSMCHVYGGRGELSAGIDFIQRTKGDWVQSDYLACHIYWHLGLLYLENNNMGQAYAIFSEQLQARAKSSLSLFHLSDAISLLFRLQCTSLISCPPQGFLSPPHCPNDFWGDWCSLALEVGARYARTHFWPFNDAHLCLLLGTADNVMRRMIGQQDACHTVGMAEKSDAVAEAYDNYLTTFSTHIKTMQKCLPEGERARWIRLKIFIEALTGLLANLTNTRSSVKCQDEVVSSVQTLANLSSSESVYQCNFCWLGGSLPQREVFTLTIVTAYLLCARDNPESMLSARKVVMKLGKVKKIGPWLSRIIATRENVDINLDTSFNPFFRDFTITPM